MSSREKIDSVYDFTEKGLVEVKAWLEPWFKKDSVAGDGALEWEDTGTGAGDGGGSGSGIQFDTYPQEGGYLEVSAVGSNPEPGHNDEAINIHADGGDVYLSATAGEDGQRAVYVNGDGGVYVHAGGDGGLLLDTKVADGFGDMIFRVGHNNGLVIESTSSYIRIRLLGTGAQLRLEGLPTSDPGVYGAVWVDAATQTLKTHGY